MFKVWNCTIGN